MKTTKNSWATAKNTKEQQELDADLSYGEEGTYGCRSFAAVLWTVQGDAAAKDDDDAELCCGGGGGGARATRGQ